MTRPILYDYYRSSASYRVRIALAMKGIAFDRVAVPLLENAQRSDDYLALNPQGFVPMLAVDGLKLTQSLAIIDYLDAQVPEPHLVPRDPADRSHVLALALTVAADVHPLNNLRVVKYLAGPLQLEPDVRDDWTRHWMAQGFAALEALAAPRAGRFLFGDAPGLADICLVPQMYNARRFDLPLEAYPALVRADAAATALDTFAAAHPDAVAPA